MAPLTVSLGHSRLNFGADSDQEAVRQGTLSCPHAHAQVSNLTARTMRCELLPPGSGSGRALLLQLRPVLACLATGT